MPSLMQAVLGDITNRSTSMTEEECLASFDLDADAISNIEGAWESVSINHEIPCHPELDRRDFVLGGSSVYERNGYMIVRGERDGKAVWFLYEPANSGFHAGNDWQTIGLNSGHP